MKLASILLLSFLVVPPAEKHDAAEIQTSINQSVEIGQPDVQEVMNLNVLAGGKTDNGGYLYVCEGDLVWTLDRKEYLELYEKFAKTVPFGELGAAMGKAYTPHFKKGDLISKVRMRVLLQKAGDDLIVMSAKTIHLDLGLKAAVASSSNK